LYSFTEKKIDEVRYCDESYIASGDEFFIASIPLEQYVLRDYIEENRPIQDTALKYFGIPYVYPWQILVVANILDSAAQSEKNSSDTASKSTEDSEEIDDIIFDEDGVERGKQIVLLPTGAGKSLCFLIPALLLKGPSLIIYPLIALMNDQERRMREGGIEPVIFRGSQSPEERERQFAALENGAKIILANPEVLQSESLIQRLAKANISHLAIDEAHCVSEWGDSFRPSYLTLGSIIKKLNIKTITAFTATASQSVLSRVAEVLFEGKAHIVRSESDRKNILYYVKRCVAKQKAALESAIVEQKPLIIFCSTRNRAEKTAKNLIGFFGPDKVKFYHAGLAKEEKEAVEKWFFPKSDAILCATCAFGMGVDKKDIKTVIHLDPPPTVEAYIQEAGRGGRDGSNAKGILLWSPKDLYEAKKHPEGSRQRALADFAESKTCRRQVLLDALNAEQAACSGCDICEKSHIDFAEDESRVLDFFKKHAKSYDMEEATDTIVKTCNEKAAQKYKMRIWESADIREIIQNLLFEKKISISPNPWKGKISIAKRKKKKIKTR
jgi:ATP-dependent DNA helicase RecQ